MIENTLNNLTVQELLRYVDRSHPEVKAPAEALEVELENNSPDGTLDEITNPKALVNNEGDIECGCNNDDDLSVGGEKPRSGWREDIYDDEYRGG